MIEHSGPDSDAEPTEALGPDIRPKPVPADAPPDPDAIFDETSYLRLYPDIAAAVSSGKRESGLEHYLRYGRAEGRHFVGRRDRWTEIRVGATAGFGAEPPTAPRHAIDAVLLGDDGRLFLIGWVDDVTVPLAALRIEGRGWAVRVQASALSRVARGDVQSALGRAERGALGFYLLLNAGTPLPSSAECRCAMEWSNGQQATKTPLMRTVPARELRDTVLTYVAGTASGGSQIPAMLTLDAMAGEQIVALNRQVTRTITASPFSERFGRAGGSPKASVIVCIYGKPEYMFLQNALFAGKPGIEDYEFIYVCNSPELLERLLKEAHASTITYGLSQTVIGLPGNAGFGAGNNLGVEMARSRRILCVNPDVLPRDPAWAARHTELVETAGTGTRLFGTTLFYDDGSLMHGGMYLELDVGLAVQSTAVQARRFARVEHYGKGAPPDTARFRRARPVPAASGAFLSVDRDWFEHLGGFSEDYVFGHYEDADLCLRSLDAGAPVWVHDIPMWHLEGRGSTRQPVHEGATIVNRWLFSRSWVNRIDDRLCGPEPTRDDLRLLAADVAA